MPGWIGTGCMFSKEDRAREWIADIVENSDRAIGHVGEMSFEQFVAHPMARDAVERCLMRITEASIRLGSERLEAIAPETPLHEMRGFGNFLRHEYQRVNVEIIWLTVKNDLPLLRQRCAAALAKGED